MAEEVRETVQGDGYAVGSLDGMGGGPGFRQLRRGLGVTAFGAIVIILPEGFDAGSHYHDEQEELYFVHRGRLEFEFGGEGESQKFVLGEGGVARVDAHTVRHITNPG